MSEKPKRIQCRRTAGYKMPAGAIYVSRPTLFGNPFPTADEFRRWLAGDKSFAGAGYGLRRLRLMSDLSSIRGKDLACWCGLDHECHADILLELANR